MNIFKNGVIYIKTKAREDFKLFKMLDIEYRIQDLEEIVNMTYQNKDISLNYLFDILFLKGYDLISENDIDQIMLWLRQISSQYKKKL